MRLTLPVINNYGPIIFRSLGYDTEQQLVLQCGWITCGVAGNLTGTIFHHLSCRRYSYPTRSVHYGQDRSEATHDIWYCRLLGLPNHGGCFGGNVRQSCSRRSKHGGATGCCCSIVSLAFRALELLTDTFLATSSSSSTAVALTWQDSFSLARSTQTIFEPRASHLPSRAPASAH